MKINTNNPYIYLLFWAASLINILILFFYIYPASISYYTGFHPIVIWILLIIFTGKATMVNNKEYVLLPDLARQILMFSIAAGGFYWLVAVKDNIFLATISAAIIAIGQLLKFLKKQKEPLLSGK